MGDRELTKLIHDAARWRFLSDSPQFALMLGSNEDPNDSSVDWVAECNKIVKEMMERAWKNSKD